ncbi:hypothetical protein FACS189468_2670 [Spirochaetia bacterium]|nr:hypothetical protein FACS189468_2670 [Spirochaetia bacterium]
MRNVLGIRLLFLLLSLPLFGEVFYSDELGGNPERMEVLRQALELLREKAPDSPVIKWSYPPEDPRYAGDIHLAIGELDSSTLGEWDGFRIVLNTEYLDRGDIQRIALIVHHEGAHADHTFMDLESVIINEYGYFFSPRQVLLFEMLNEAFALYKEVTLQYALGVNIDTAHKYETLPSVARYEEDFFRFFKDLRRWMKGAPRYNKLRPDQFDNALFREFVIGFFSDPWYLDYYMPASEQEFIIHRSRDFAVCPMVCNPRSARFLERDNIYAVLDRYIEKNTPRGLSLGLRAEALEGLLENILDTFEPGDEPGDNRGIKTGYGGAGEILAHLAFYRASQRNFEALPSRFRSLPDSLPKRYTYSHSPEELAAFDRLLDTLGTGSFLSNP